MQGGRGQDLGRGQGGGRGQGLGLGGSCVCSNCGHKEPHQRAVPCYDLKCPKCNTPLVREG